jgi:hypothetical protein
MNASRLVSLLAAVLVTAAQWTALFCLLAPTLVEAAPVATPGADDALPVIVITAERPAGAAAGGGHQ